MHDVPEHIEQIDDQMAPFCSKTGAERLAIANSLLVSARRMLESLLRNDHPDWDEPRLQGEVSRRNRMELSELLRQVASILDRQGVPYLITGSVATGSNRPLTPPAY
jgi:hypothetical protein